jgi:hypothetical protein
LILIVGIPGPTTKKPTGGVPVGFLFPRGFIAGKPAELS